MGAITNISWTATVLSDGTVRPGATWNPWMGCHKVSAGCKHCFMYRDMARYGREPNVVTRAKPGTFNNPLRWAQNGKVQPGARIFTCSWSDWFIQEADPWRDEAWDIIRRTPQFTYLICTKRPERISEHLPADWGNGWPHVWLGVTTENQEMADRRIPILLAVPARIRWLSVEPMLEPITFADACNDWLEQGIGWIVTGGESGPNTRPADPEWFRYAQRQCQAARVPYFHKQLGGTRKIDGAWGGRVLDGRIWNEFPADG